MRHSSCLVRDDHAASAAEFALVLPLLLIFLLGIIDTGRFLWECNMAEKATQMGVRYAVVGDLVPAGLYEYSFAISDSIPQGTTVPAANFDHVTCDSSGCSDDCAGTICPLGFNANAFANIVNRMDAMRPGIALGDVEIEYRNVGLGYSGDPNGPDVSPLVTVRFKPGALTFQPITCLVFACPINMPDFRAALTLEDGNGSVSN